MLKNNIKNIPKINFFILILSLFALSNDLTVGNKLFWLILFFISFFFFRINFKLKSIIVGIAALLALYLQLIFNQYILSEEFFLNSLGVLLICKISELNSKNSRLSFNLIAMIIAIASLIKGQDILSTLTSFAIVISLVVNMYTIQQKELLNFSIKNVVKYIGFGLSIFPIIIIFYLIFPRAELNIKLFDTSTSSLGIPDTISLGSFNEFSNSDEDVFTLINKNFKQEDLYFRVKIFDYLEKDGSWRPSSNYFLFNKFKDSFKIQNQLDLNKSYQIILEPYKNKWIPSLKNSKLITKDIEITKDHLNQSFVSRELIDKKKSLIFKKNITNYSFENDIRAYYTLLPSNISPKIVAWVNKNHLGTDEEFLKKIYDKFSNGNFYYNLSPKQVSKNKYEDFFFESKEGYCEYYAGTFVLLARLANIPSRIVTGYFGGELNEIGNFYQFKQKDTHAWAEVLLDGKGWVRVDPTRAIPKSNVINSFNNFFSEQNTSSNSIFSSDFVRLINFYFNYADFVWTQHLLSYDDEERKNFIKDLYKFEFKSLYIWIFFPIIIFILIKFILGLNRLVVMKFILQLILLGRKNKYKIKKSDTLQQIHFKLSDQLKLRYRKFFDAIEKEKYSNRNITNYEFFSLIKNIILLKT